MSKHLERDLELLQASILSMSSMVEEMIDQAIQALIHREAALADQVIARDREVDMSEVRIEEECLKILALHQPVAVDLRRTVMVMKINNDLERIADLAVNIAERVKSLSMLEPFPLPESLENMASWAVLMVRDALDSFVNLDPEAARDVCLRDARVDASNRQIIEGLCEVMKADPVAVESALHCFSASRHIERIADHATNIAEDVIYLVEGEIARHREKEFPNVTQEA